MYWGCSTLRICRRQNKANKHQQGLDGVEVKLALLKEPLGWQRSVCGILFVELTGQFRKVMLRVRKADSRPSYVTTRVEQSYCTVIPFSNQNSGKHSSVAKRSELT